MKITIRPATENDAAQVLEVFRNVVHDGNEFISTSPADFNLTLDEERQYIANFIADPNSQFLVALADEKIAGYLQYRNNVESRIKHTGVVGLNILQQYRDIKMGHRLLEYFFEWASYHQDIEQVQLIVFSNNERGIHLYQKFGFVIDGRQKNAVKLGEGRYVDKIMMSKVMR